MYAPDNGYLRSAKDCSVVSAGRGHRTVFLPVRDSRSDGGSQLAALITNVMRSGKKQPVRFAMLKLQVKVKDDTTCIDYRV